MPGMNTYFDTFDKEKESLLKEYFHLLRFRGLSADLQTMPELLACANFLEKKLKGLGAHVEKWSIDGHPPVVFASFKSDSKDAPTLLIYNHYDVQPVDPENLWHSPPFEPTIRDGKVYARGAEDNKGQLFYTLVAFEAFLKKVKNPPFNLKWVIEGEEEHGSTALQQLLPKKKDAIKADGILVVDVGIPSLSKPALGLGVRGIITMDLKVTGPKGDMHSGYGGSVLNPLHYLVEILSKARNEEGKITIPGFYDAVETLSEADKKLICFKLDEKEFFETNGVPTAGGEKGPFSPGERSTIRPTLEVNGINGGYSGEGFKTVIPSEAHAKISCRLVPDQDPLEMGRIVKKYFESQSTPAAKVEVHLHPGGGKAVRCSPQSFLIKAANAAVKETFGKNADYILVGGSIPIAADLATYSGGDLLFIGTALPTDNIHAPNEHFSLEQLRYGTSLIGHLFEHFVEEFKR